MSNYTKMYWLTRLDKLNTIFVLFLLAGVVLLGLVIIAWLSRDDKDSITTEVLKKLKGIKIVSYIFIFIGIIGVSFCPTKIEAIEIIAGGKVIDFVQQDTSLSKIPAQSTQVITNYLDHIIKDIETEKQEK